MSSSSSDFLIQLVALGSVILIGVLTYVFGYKSKPNDDDEILHVETKETKKQKIERAKKAESKDKKKPKEPKPAAVVQHTPAHVSLPIVSKKENKDAKPQPNKAEKTNKKAIKEVKPAFAEIPVQVEEPTAADGWTKVTDKKQKNKSVVEPVKVKAQKKEVQKEAKVEKVHESIVDQDETWITVTDKKQKKITGSSSENSTPSPVPAKSKKTKSEKSDFVEKVFEPVPKPEKKREEVKSVEQAAEDSEWITANSKASKKKAKAQVKQVDPEPVKEKSAPVSDSPKSGKKSKSKGSDEVQTVSVLKVEQAKTADNSKPPEVPQAIQELINAQSTSPNSVAASIIQQFQNDRNNNLVEKAKPTVTSTTEVKKSKETKKSKSSSNSETILKSTNLTESMILIDSIASNGKTGSRTDSNPSSSESLQDLDVGDGWATITSKKKRTVRRDA